MFFTQTLSDDLLAGRSAVESFRRAASDVSIPSTASTVSSYLRSPTLFVESPGSVHSLKSSSSMSALTGQVQAITSDSVDDFRLKTIRVQIGAKSWQGHKRLGKETANLARFRSLMELYLSENPVAESASASLPAFSLVTAFTVKGVRILASAELKGDKFNVMPMDKRDLTELTGALKAAKTLRYFPYQDFPQLWVRQIPGRKETSLVRVGTRYDDVLCNSLRSKFVHGIIIRAAPGSGSGNPQMIEALSAADLRELVADKTPQSVPFLNLVYYQLDTPASSKENYPAKSFLLKSSSSLEIPLKGDVVISVEDETCKVPLNLLEGFVLKRQIEIHPLVRRLQELKKNNAVLGLMSAIASSRNGRLRQDVGLGVAHEFENNVKAILARHVKEFASQLVTLGDVLPTPVSNGTILRSQTVLNPAQQRLARSNTTLVAPRSADFVSMASFSNGDRDRLARPAIRRRRSSLAATTLQEEAVDNKGTYVVDALHLRHVMREEGVNISLLPLVFHHLDEHRQHGMQIIVASEIIVRLAKTLFRYRQTSDPSKLLTRWKLRKARTIKFIDSIIHGLFHDDLSSGRCPIRECFGDQFWKVDGPIWFALGTFSGCFSLDSRIFKETGSLEKFRQLLKANPSILLSGLLRAFGARLAATVMPETHENRFLTVPFLRNESDIVFDDEDAGTHQDVAAHPSMLWSYLQFFRIQFERVNTSSMSKEDNGSWLQFYKRQVRAFRGAIGIQTGTSLERAICSWEDQMAVRAHLGLALRGISTSLSPEVQASAQESCRQARHIISTSSVLFPVEYKVALRCLELICAGQDLPTGLEKSEELLETLRFFYRPANLAQFVKNASSHPVYSLQFANSPDTFQQHATPKTCSLRSELQKEQDRAAWVGIMPAVDAYCRRVEAKRRDPVMVASLRAVLSGSRHTGRYQDAAGVSRTFEEFRATRDVNNVTHSSSSDRFDSNSSLNSDSSVAARAVNSLGGAHYGISSAPMKSSSQVDALWFIESYLLPPVSGANESWMLPGSLLMADTSSLHKQKSLRATEIEADTSVPGAAFLWGKPFGLSLDEEARLSSTVEASEDSASRPDSSIMFLRVPEPLRRVVSVSCGYRHTALVTHDRQLYTFGYGECGRLGHGNEESYDEPTLVSYFSSRIRSDGASAGGVVSVSCGREHTMVVIGSGDLYGFGWAEAGRLGTGESESCLFPARVSALKEKIRDVACGREHTLALTRSGAIYAFGAGFGGRLGNGSEVDAELPVLVEGLAGQVITKVDAGECHSCALSDDGDVFTWGFGASGALGHGTKENCLAPKLVEGPWMLKRRGFDPALLVVSSIACGSYHTLACSVDGTLYGWGDAAAGQLGDELLSSPDMIVLTPQTIRLPVGIFSRGSDTNGGSAIRQVACGTFTSALTTHDGKLYTWGSAAAGNGAKLNVHDAQVRRVEALAEFSFAQVACGAHHTVALTRKLEYY